MFFFFNEWIKQCESSILEKQIMMTSYFVIVFTESIFRNHAMLCSLKLVLERSKFTLKWFTV